MGIPINIYQCYQYKSSNIQRHTPLQHGNQSSGFFSLPLLSNHRGLPPSLLLLHLSRATPPPPIAIDDDRQTVEATEFRKKLDTIVDAVANAKKRYDVTCARVLTTIALLEEEEEEEHVATILANEAHAVVALIEPPLPMSPRPPLVALLHQTITMRSPSSPTSTSWPPACRTYALLSQSC
jgi:hypothetical protein